MHRPCGFQHDSQEATLNKGCKLVLDKQCACPWKTNWSGSNCVHPSNILRFGAAVTEPPARGRQLLSAAMSWGLAAPATPRPTGGCRKTGVSVNGQLASPGGGRSPAQPLQGATTEDSGDAGTRLVDSWWGIGTPDHAAGSGAGLGHELRAACDTLSRSALPSVAVAVQGSWVPASGPQAHPLDERKKHMESTKLPQAAGVMECILYCMDDSAAFVASPEHQ